MPQVLCPVIVGREPELATLAALVAGAAGGRGGAVVVQGEAGVGKSRLVTEAADAARERGATVLVGRGSETVRAPFRPLTEAVLGALRAGAPPETPELAPFRPALARFVPQWRDRRATTVDDDVVMLAEGLLRLLSDLGNGAGTVVVLEDLHWADPETVAVLDYLAGNLADSPVLLVATVRTGEPGPGSELADRLARRRDATIVELHRLGPDAATRVATAALRVDKLSDGQRRAVERAEGLPFLIEELLGMATAPGADVDGVPATVADTVRRRLDALLPDGRAACAVVALAGWPLDPGLLANTAGLDDPRLTAAMQQLDASALLQRTPEGLIFRHSLTRDAVLAELLPHERRRLADALLDAIRAEHPGLDGEWCRRAANLAGTAGRDLQAAELLLESARRAAGEGALATAESLLDSAGAHAGGDLVLAANVDELRVDVLALAGRWDQVFEIGNRLLGTLVETGAPAPRRARVHLRLARSANDAKQPSLARRHLADAEQLAAGSARDDVLAAAEALHAHVAIDDQDLDGALVHAQRAIAMSESTGLPEVTCEALEVVGRLARLTDLSAAEAALRRAVEIAEAADLPVWRLRALHELGIVEMFARGSTDRMLEARDLAFRSGALTVAIDVDLQLAGFAAVQFRATECRAAAVRAAEGARQLRLAVPLAMALVHRAGAEAELGDFAAVEPILAEAAAVGGDHPDVTAFSAGHVRATALLLQEDRAAALEQLDLAMEISRHAPSTPPGQWRGLWPLVCAVVDRDGEAAVAEIRAAGHTTPLVDALLPFTDAVLAGRAGDHRAAATAFAYGDELGRAFEGFRQLSRRLVAECAIHDGWGEPVPWLRSALAWSDAHGYTRVADACRALLREAGAPAPRRRNAATVAPELQALGVTAREAAVLELVGEGLSNAEIAERLFISSRTAEKHVERLLAKFGVPERRSLRAAARALRT